MTDQVLDILKLVLLALLYLFFARVLWAVWSEVRQPANARIAVDAACPSRGTGTADRYGAGRTGGADDRQAGPSGPRGDARPARHARTEGAARHRVRDRRTDRHRPRDRQHDRDHRRCVHLVASRHDLPRPTDDVVLDDLGSRNGTFLNGIAALHPAARPSTAATAIQVGYTVLEAQW